MAALPSHFIPISKGPVPATSLCRTLQHPCSLKPTPRITRQGCRHCCVWSGPSVEARVFLTIGSPAARFPESSPSSLPPAWLPRCPFPHHLCTGVWGGLGSCWWPLVLGDLLRAVAPVGQCLSGQAFLLRTSLPQPLGQRLSPLTAGRRDSFRRNAGGYSSAFLIRDHKLTLQALFEGQPHPVPLPAQVWTGQPRVRRMRWPPGSLLPRDTAATSARLADWLGHGRWMDMKLPL